MGNSIVFFIIILIATAQPCCCDAPVHTISHCEQVVYGLGMIAIPVWVIVVSYFFGGENEDGY